MVLVMWIAWTLLRSQASLDLRRTCQWMGADWMVAQGTEKEYLRTEMDLKQVMCWAERWPSMEVAFLKGNQRNAPTSTHPYIF